MTIKIQRGRQFEAGKVDVELFNKDGKAGTFLQKAADKLVAQEMTLTLRGAFGRTVTVATADDWKKFLSQNCDTPDQTKAFTRKFGITFSDFVNVIDDAAMSDDKGLNLDLRPTSELGKSLSLDLVDGDYATKLKKDAAINLTGANNVTSTAVATGTVTIGKEILATPVQSDWQRDRTEQESWADFKTGNGATSKFRENTGPKPFEKLHEPKWNDPEAMAIVEKFTLPLHLEVSRTNPDGTPRFQDGSEMFRDTYFDNAQGALSKNGTSVRARVRFDDDEPFTVNRVLIQAKDGRNVDGTASAVRKFEKRWEGNFTDETKAHDMLKSGKEENGGVLAVSQKLYKLLDDKRALPRDGNLTLDPKYMVLQKRRRTHLQLDSVREVEQRRTGVQTEMDKLKADGKAIPPELEKFAAKLDSQIKFLNEASDVLQKYDGYMPSGECFIISADRYNVYDPAVRGIANPPNDLDDEAGLIGKGPLHIEAEWDSASSDTFEKALKKIDEELAKSPTAEKKAELTADKAKIEDIRKTFRADVQQTVNVMAARLEAAGLEQEPTKKSKDERAAEIVANTKKSVNWL